MDQRPQHKAKYTEPGRKETMENSLESWMHWHMEEFLFYEKQIT